MTESPGSVSEIRRRLESASRENPLPSPSGGLGVSPIADRIKAFNTPVGESPLKKGTAPAGSTSSDSPISSSIRSRQAELNALQQRLAQEMSSSVGSQSGQSQLGASLNASAHNSRPVSSASIVDSSYASTATMGKSVESEVSLSQSLASRPSTAPNPPGPPPQINVRPPSAGVQQVTEADMALTPEAGGVLEKVAGVTGGAEVDQQQMVDSDDSEGEGRNHDDESDEEGETNCGEAALSPRVEQSTSVSNMVSEKRKELEAVFAKASIDGSESGGVAKQGVAVAPSLQSVQATLSKQVTADKLNRHLQQRPSVIQLANQGLVSAASLEPCIEAALNFDKKAKRQETLKNKLEQKLKPSASTNSAVISFSVMKYNKRNKSQPRLLQFDIAEQCLRNYEKEELQKSFPFRDLTGVVEAPDPMRLFIRFTNNKEYEVVVQDPEERQTLSQLTQLIIKTLDRPKDPNGTFRGNFEMLFDNVLPYDPAPSSHLPIDRYKSGPVDKKGKRNWAGRWMVAGVSNLYIYRDKKSSVPLNVLALRHVHVTPTELNKFTLVCPHRTFIFRCTSEAERNDWLDALTKESASEFSR